MDAVAFSRAAYPVALMLFPVLAFVLPALRLWRRTGTWAITGSRNRDPAERAVQLLLLLCSFAFGAWGSAYAADGPRALQVLALPGWTIWAGWTLAAAGLALVMAAQAQMGASWRIGIDAEATPLVTGGLFAIVRNPIYSGLCLFGAGLLLVSPSPWLGAIELAAGILIRVQTLREERYLRRLHGRSFEDWAGRVGRFLPWIGRVR
jgi:protein-S-isoprenylcysteine O-methyltransferase Ste14